MDGIYPTLHFPNYTRSHLSLPYQATPRTTPSSPQLPSPVDTGAHARTRCYVCPIDTCKQVPHLHASSLPLLSYRVRKGLGPLSDSRSVVLLMRAVGGPPAHTGQSPFIHPRDAGLYRSRTCRLPVQVHHSNQPQSACSASPVAEGTMQPSSQQRATFVPARPVEIR